jgi:hypothetical protein
MIGAIGMDLAALAPIRIAFAGRSLVIPRQKSVTTTSTRPLGSLRLDRHRRGRLRAHGRPRRRVPLPGHR